MQTRTKRLLQGLLVITAVGVAPAALGAPYEHHHERGRHWPTRFGAPEFDPAAAGAVAALIAGGGLLIANRRKAA